MLSLHLLRVVLGVRRHLHGVGCLVVLLLHLLLLHAVDVVHDHLLLGLGNFLRVDGLLRRVLRLLHVHFLVLTLARRLAALRGVQGRCALLRQVRMARILPLGRPANGDCRLALTRGQLRFGCASYTYSSAHLLVLLRTQMVHLLGSELDGCV